MIRSRTFKFVLFVQILVFCITAAAVPFMGAYEDVDIESLEENQHSSVIEYINSYGCFCVVNEKYGNYFSLGQWDLSKFKSITISYGADNKAEFQNEEKGSAYIALTTGGAVQDTQGAKIDDVNIIGQTDIPVPEVSWGRDELEITFDSDYSGEVFLAIFHVSEGHNCLISEITFYEKDGGATSVPTEPADTTPDKSPDVTATADKTEPPSTEPTQSAAKATETASKVPVKEKPSEEDSGFIITLTVIVVVLVAAAVIAVIIIKKKNKGDK